MVIGETGEQEFALPKAPDSPLEINTSFPPPPPPLVLAFDNCNPADASALNAALLVDRKNDLSVAGVGVSLAIELKTLWLGELVCWWARGERVAPKLAPLGL